MKDITVRSLRENEKGRFFEFATSLPDRDLWGKKSSRLKGDLQRFQEFLDYFKPFQSKCFLVAEEDNNLVGFIVAIYNRIWNSELRERHGYDVDKRAHILGIAFAKGRKDVLNPLIDKLIKYFSRKGIKDIEYPTLGNICLTTGTDVLIPENIDALLMFREAGFKISECYYSMKLDLDTYKQNKKSQIETGSFRFNERSIEIVKENEVLGNITWDPIKNGTTSISISLARRSRGRGFGTALMAEALHQMKIQGVKIIELGVDGNNLPALKLYRKFGFAVYRTHFYIIIHC